MGIYRGAKDSLNTSEIFPAWNLNAVSDRLLILKGQLELILGLPSVGHFWRSSESGTWIL